MEEVKKFEIPNVEELEPSVDELGKLGVDADKLEAAEEPGNVRVAVEPRELDDADDEAEKVEIEPPEVPTEEVEGSEAEGDEEEVKEEDKEATDLMCPSSFEGGR